MTGKRPNIPISLYPAILDEQIEPNKVQPDAKIFSSSIFTRQDNLSIRFQKHFDQFAPIESNKPHISCTPLLHRTQRHPPPTFLPTFPQSTSRILITYKNIDEFRELPGPTIDVRSPSEFADGHIPGAINIPLFDDQQRAEVGTAYAKQGQDAAIFLGFKIASSRVEPIISQIRATTDAQMTTGTIPIKIHCWRGGMRSQSVAWLARQFKLQPTVLAGGYKSYRANALRAFQTPRSLIVLSGLTGSGKTRMLGNLKNAGEQVVDLEGLANHRGSAFGGIGLPPQPMTQHFENLLFEQLRCLEPNRRTWVEDESRGIGKIRIPQDLWEQMRHAPVLFVDVALDKRVDILLDEYGKLPTEQLALAVQQITKRFGTEKTNLALKFLEANEFRRFTELTLEYYDHGYRKSAMKRESENVFPLVVEEPESQTTTSQLIEVANQIGSRPGLPMKAVLDQLRQP